MRLSPETLDLRSLFRLGGEETALEIRVHLIQAALRVTHWQIAPGFPNAQGKISF